jgi:uncharacterized membrane protein (UPF0127 family)
MMKKAVAAALFFLLFAFISCAQKMERATLSVRGRPLVVEIARTDAQRAKGLMGRETLGWSEGMLFVFREDQVLNFWMKNTVIPLSIAFLDKSGKVTDIFDMIPYNEAPVASSARCRYALETNRGFFGEAGLVPGDGIDLGSVK